MSISRLWRQDAILRPQTIAIQVVSHKKMIHEVIPKTLNTLFLSDLFRCITRENPHEH